MRIELIQDTPGLLALADRWRGLVAASPRKTVFQSFEANAAWWSAVGSRDGALTLHVVVVRDGDRDLALAPLMLRREGEETSLVFLGSPYFDYHDILGDPADPRGREALLRYIATDGPWRRVLLDEIPAASNLLGEDGAATQSLEAARLLLREASVCPYLDLKHEECFRRAVRKERIRAKARKLGQQGVLAFAHHHGVEQVRERFDAFKAMHSARWMDREDVVAPFEELEVSRFFDELVERSGTAGHLLLSELTLDAVPIAYSFGFVFEGTYFFYRMAYERRLSASSPGHILLRDLMHHLKDRGLGRYDFMRGTYEYKYWYAHAEQQNRRLESA